MVTTNLSRANGQIERLRTIIPVLTKLAMNDPTKWYKYVPIVQQTVNSTFHRSISMTSFELLTGVKMKQKNDLTVKSAVEEFRLRSSRIVINYENRLKNKSVKFRTKIVKEII